MEITSFEVWCVPETKEWSLLYGDNTDRSCAGTRTVELRKDRPAPEASSGRKEGSAKTSRET